MKKIIIPKNWHYAINVLPWKPFCTKDSMVMRREYSFTDSCKYEINEKSCVNKLCGFSTGMHHNDSVRVGWTYEKNVDSFALWAYIYDDGILIKKKICYVNSNEQFIVKIYKIKYMYHIKIFIGSMTYEFDYEYDELLDTPFSYYLEPYFGGNTRAPHRMEIIQY